MAWFPSKAAVLGGSATLGPSMREHTRTRFRQFLPLLAFAYSGSMVSVAMGSHYPPDLISCAVVAVAAAARALFRRNLLPEKYSDAAAMVLGVLVLSQSLVRLAGSNTTNQVSVLVLILIGGSLVLSSFTGWLCCFVSPAMLGWMSVTSGTLPPHTRNYGLVVLVATSAMTGVAYWMRARRDRRFAALEAALSARTAEEKLRQEKFTAAVNASLDGLWHWDLKANTLKVSESWRHLLGCEESDLDSTPEDWMNRVHPGYADRLRTDIWEHVRGVTPQLRNVHRVRRQDGTYVWVSVHGTAIRDQEGTPLALAGSLRDIGNVIEVDKRELNDAFHDRLTGLANRDYLMSRLERLMEKKQSGSTNLFAVMFLDLDRFKSINDTMGHQVGDQLLIGVSGRLKNCVRPQDIVARFGGDEFAVLLESVKSPEESREVAERVRSSLSSPFSIEGREIASGASIGIVLSTESAKDAAELLRYADMAMYQAKAQRKGNVHVYDEDLHARKSRASDLQSDLVRAVEREQLVLHYQPCISTATGRITGLEALVRWQRSPGELLSPREFLPLAEEMGFGGEIGEWVLRTACAQNSAWQKAGLAPVRVGVNLFPRQLQHKDFARTVERVLRETNLAPGWLELELTEKTLMSDPEAAAEILGQLAAGGVHVSIDDFGTGYISLGHLRQFDFSRLKIDRGLIADIATDGKAAAVAKGMISLAHSLELSVVAEGVERSDQVRFLAANRCDHLQGYLASRPLPADRCVELLRSGTVIQPGSTEGIQQVDLIPGGEFALLAQALGQDAPRALREPIVT